jgi:hypothetical protein
MNQKEVDDLKPITVRGISTEIEKMIRKEAKNKRLSLNKTLIGFLEKGAGIKGVDREKVALYHDLDHLCGVWTKEEAQTFERSLDFQRKIEEELWKKTGS